MTSVRICNAASKIAFLEEYEMRKMLWAISIAGNGYALLLTLLFFLGGFSRGTPDDKIEMIALLLLAIACSVGPFLFATSIEKFRESGKG